MIPERLGFLKPLDRFYKVIIEQVKTNCITEAEFYMLLSVKCKSMNKERLKRPAMHQDSPNFDN